MDICLKIFLFCRFYISGDYKWACQPIDYSNDSEAGRNILQKIEMKISENLIVLLFFAKLFQGIIWSLIWYLKIFIPAPRPWEPWTWPGCSTCPSSSTCLTLSSLWQRRNTAISPSSTSIITESCLSSVGSEQSRLEKLFNMMDLNLDIFPGLLEEVTVGSSRSWTPGCTPWCISITSWRRADPRYRNISGGRGQ